MQHNKLFTAKEKLIKYITASKKRLTLYDNEAEQILRPHYCFLTYLYCLLFLPTVQCSLELVRPKLVLSASKLNNIDMFSKSKMNN